MPKIHRVAADVWRQIIILIVTIVLTGSSLLLLSLLVPSSIFKMAVGIIARITRPDLAGFVYGKRVVMAVKSPHKKPKFVQLVHLVLDGSLPAEKIRLAYQQKIQDHSNGIGDYSHFQQTWTQFLGFLFWRWEKDFNLNHHIRYYDFQDKNLVVPDICTEADLERVTPALLAKPFKEGTSPWELLIIPNYRAASNSTGKAQSVIVCRLHHLLADGHSLLNLFFKMFDLQGSKFPQPHFPKASLVKRIWTSVGMPLILPYYLASQVVQGFHRSDSWDFHGKKLSGKYHAFFSDQVPVDRIKEIKNKYGVSYNLASYAVVVGGMRRLLMEVGQKVPRNLSCYVPLPVPNHPGGLVFHVSGFVFSFCPQVESPVERLGHLSKKAQIVNDDPAVQTALSSLLDLMLVMLPVAMVKLLDSKLPITLGISSFPGPEHELDIMGTAKVVDAIGAVGHPAWQLGAVGVLISMAGKQRFVLTMDRVIFEACRVPLNFAKHINDEVSDLLGSDGSTVQGTS